jgi:hypothetical protein
MKTMTVEKADSSHQAGVSGKSLNHRPPKKNNTQRAPEKIWIVTRKTKIPIWATALPPADFSLDTFI